MSKLLKLTGLKSYISPVTGTVQVQRNEVVRFTDEMAEKIADGHRRDLEGNPVPYWTDPLVSDTKVHHDFSGGEKTAEAEEATAAPARAPSRQRRTS